MAGISSKSPFTPGTGKRPPFLAGRGPEKKILAEDFLERTVPGDSPSSPCVIFGPRGNGKTAMLRWIKEECERREMDCVFANGKSAGTLTQLALQLLPNSQSLRKRVRQAGASAAGFGAQIALQEAETIFERELLERCKDAPLVFLLDEAHIVESEVLCTLLNAAQHVQGEECPFALVLAGTPQLRRTLNEAGASFWPRSRKVSLGLLERKASRQALTRPFGLSLKVDESALDRALDEAQGYPYFIQLMGDALWKADRKEISRDSLRAALAQFRKDRNAYYSERYDELEEQGLHEAAARVARAFGGRSDRLTLAQLRFACAPRAAAQVQRKIAATLRDLGYVWKPAGKSRYERSIPSLMAYVTDTLNLPHEHANDDGDPANEDEPALGA